MREPGIQGEVERLHEAPDFTLVDTGGREVRLSSYRGRRRVVLVFNRGFF